MNLDLMDAVLLENYDPFIPAIERHPVLLGALLLGLSSFQTPVA